MFASQLAACLGKFRRCGLIGENTSLGVGFEVSFKNPCQAKSFSLFSSCRSYVSSQLLLQDHFCLLAAMLLTMMIMEYPLKR